MLKHLTLGATLFAAPLSAEGLKVVADIPPVHSLVAQVMGGLGAPELLTQPGTDPHRHALRPSEAARLQSAELLVWVGLVMSPWLAEARTEMAAEAASLSLMEADGTTILAKRGADHDHDHGDDHGDDHAHDDDHAHEDEHKHDEDHAHDEHAHDDDHKHEDEHAHDEGHDHDHGDDHAEEGGERPDPHVWLSPDNAALWLGLIAEELAERDPANAETYRANAAAAAAALRDQAAEIETRIAKVSDLEFLTAHDAYQYFQARFGLTSHAAITDSDDQDAGPAHLREVLENSPGLGCFVVEPSTPAAQIKLVTSTLDIPAVVIDPLGTELPLGAGHYSALMEEMAAGFETCLTK